MMCRPLNFPVQKLSLKEHHDYKQAYCLLQQMGDILEFQTEAKEQQTCWIENEVLVHLLIVQWYSCGYF
uniref:Uncharacterized protein n=1 Tax=Arundo donax TaxID=35708 RepID=A0A0A9I341_ARUDO